MPHVTTAEFLKQRSKYVAKYGYRYAIPGFDDVIHLPFENPITPEETQIWKNKQFSKLSPERYEELKYIKNKRKEAYLNMLGSPSPQIFKSRGALLGAIDDMEDALSVLSVVGAVAVRSSPAILQKMMMGPLGLLFTATEALQLATAVLTPEMRRKAIKKKIEELQDLNPRTTKGKITTRKRMRLAEFNRYIAIEALQTTDNVFGIGISLGAIMNLPVDIIFGAARRMVGNKSEVIYPIPNIDHWKARAMKAMKGVATYLSIKPDKGTLSQNLIMLAANASAQVINYFNRENNTLDTYPDIKDIQFEAPKPSNPLTIEVMMEIDPEGLNAIKWPTTDKRWSTGEELSETMPDPITKSFKDYQQTESRSMEGFIGAINGTEAGMNMLEAAEGKDTVKIDYAADTKAITGLLNAGYTFPKNITVTQTARWKLFTDSYEEKGIYPRVQDSLNFAKNVAGFEFVKIRPTMQITTIRKMPF